MTAGPYIPGQTERPPEGAFDHLKGVAEPLAECPAWRAGKRFFREGFFWEAHEVWEAVWMAAPENSAEKVMVQGAIQLANARLKRRMGRDAAAAKLEGMAWGLMAEAWRRADGPVMGLVRPMRDGLVHYNAETVFGVE